MPGVPDSGWLTAIAKVELWFSGSIALGLGALYALWHWKVAPFAAVPTLWVAGGASVGVLASCLFVGRSAKLLVEFVTSQIDRDSLRIRRKFFELSDAQRSLVATVVATGHSNFTNVLPEPRWLEELIRWNYVIAYGVFSGDVRSYRLTDAAWEHVKKLVASQKFKPPSLPSAWSRR